MTASKFEIPTLPKDLKSRTGRTVQGSNKSIETIFTDEEAIQICGGITYDNYARRIWASYYKHKATLNDMVNAHEIALKMLDKYGIEHLSTIMSLPPHEVFKGDVSAAFSELDKKRHKLNCPRIYLKHRGKRYSIKYLLTITRQNKKVINNRDLDTLVLADENETKNKIYIHRSGRVSFSDKASIKKPMLTLLVTFLKSPSEVIGNFGKVYMECIECGRVLTDMRSRKAEMGHTCAIKTGHKWG